MEIQLSVIIVNYNGLKYLKGCFDALHDKLQDIPHEIIVTDNNSPDDSCTYIKDNYPNVVLIESKENLGFGKGNNVGVQQAKGQYLLLINNDTIVLNNLAPVLDVLKRDGTVGAVGIKMLGGNENYLYAAGKFPGINTLYRIKNQFNMGPEFKTGNFTKAQYEVDWLTGSFLMVPKAVYNQIGGFDEDYFMYVEDVDFCKKVQEHGYKRLFLPQYSYIHYVGYNNSKDHLVVKGLDLYIQKHTSGLYKQLCIAALGINKTIKAFKKALNLN